MKLVIGCEDTGAIKVINAPHGIDTSKPITEDSPQPQYSISTYAVENTKKDKVLQLVHSRESGNIIVSRQNGSIEVYDTTLVLNSEQTTDNNSNNDSKKDVDNKDSSRDIDLLPLIYQHKNIIPPLTSNDGEIFINLSVDESNRIVLATNKGSVFIWKSENDINKDPVKLTLPLNEKEVVEAFQIHPGADNVDYVAYGGKETDLRVAKLPTLKDMKKDNKKQPEIVFKAKNVSNSRLELRVPIHIKKLLFDKSSTPKNFKIYTFTAWGDMRFYESSAGRKPRSSILVLPRKAPIINVTWISDELVVSDNTGIVVKVNPLSGAQISKFKGQIGTTQALDNFKDSILATTGSDRYIRAYDNNTRECLVKVFVGTQSNAIAIIEDNEQIKQSRGELLSSSHAEKKASKVYADSAKEKEQEDEESSDEEELWNKLESNITQRRKRRKLTLA